MPMCSHLSLAYKPYCQFSASGRVSYCAYGIAPVDCLMPGIDCGADAD
jgi:hypothetical protein